MPEGPEVKVISDKIKDNKFYDKKFKEALIIENVNGKLHRFSKKPITRLNQLKNFKISKVSTKGKLITFVFEIENQVPRLFGLNTLGMSGTWKWNSKDHKHARLSFIGENFDLTFIDPRCFGSFKIVLFSQALKKMENLGHDLLVSPVDHEKWKLFKHHKSIRNIEIGPALMTQHLFCGIGNIYKSEILYEAKIDPKTIVEEISDYKWDKLNIIAHKILKLAYENNGTTIKTFEANGRNGKNQFFLKVYGKKQTEEGPVKTIIQDGRKTYFCPKRVENG